ncbi:MAG: polysaccharide deacetylase family protein [Prevotellaceae bacterium]|jgi:peptidoglycan/xylan/chitin deacetylase (PgdA/CDA1 family)|nr:polysaccharide deacetylase family protein [Prevotellaceae bacterium]
MRRKKILINPKLCNRNGGLSKKWYVEFRKLCSLNVPDRTTANTLLFIQQFAFLLFPILTVCSIINHWYIFFCVSGLITAVLVWGIFDMRLALFVPVINRLKTGERKIVLTFDDGPGKCTDTILSILERENIRAIFFFTGKNALEHVDIVKRTVQSGHLIGIHTQNHLLEFPFSGLKKVNRELKENIMTIEQITGQKINLFRPPFGVMNPVIAKSVRDLKLCTTGWTVRSLDTGAKNGERLLKRISKRLSAGAIILLHDIPLTAGILQDLIVEIRRKGYEV